MVKKQGGREMNPADAHRKAQRQKEILRNKKERKFQRDAHALQKDPDAIKDQLKEVLDLEENGRVNLTLRLKKRALQGAYDTAVKKRKEEQVKQSEPDGYTFTGEHGHGVLDRRPEDSVYYHPTLNPSGMPPPGKPQRYETGSAAADHRRATTANLPLPQPPPLPAGPAPSYQPAAPMPPPPGPAPGDAQAPLPPPEGPPPGHSARPEQPGTGPAPLPPPAGPPPGMFPLPPPVGPPPGIMPHVMLPPPAMPPPDYAWHQPLPSGAGPLGAMSTAKKDATISAASTVVKMPRADMDKTVTALVPTSVRRAANPSAGAKPLRPAPMSVGMVPKEALKPSAAPVQNPRQTVPVEGGTGVLDRKYQDFLAEMADLGALAA